MASRRKRRRIPRALLLVTAMLVVAAAAWGTGLLFFVGSMPSRVDDPDSVTDAIVILTGGSERLNTGLRLLAENKAKQVFVSGVHPTVDVDRLLQLGGRSEDSLQQRIDAGHGAQDTHGNAEETAAWMRARGYRSLRLVTGSYHMPRSLLEFRDALPEARIVPHPVFPDRVKQSSWWLRPGTALLIIGEYNKFLLAVLLHRWQAVTAQMSSGSGP
jgi:uncharacterized SAM-binding protein YcdF (DUF218 family)